MRGYVQNGLASQVAKTAGSGTEEEVLMRIMLRVRKTVLNPRSPQQIRFDPRVWPALVAGVGYCDQINGAISLAAAHRFPRAELVALYDPKTHTLPHTVGRVWSTTRRDWLYFDAYYAEPIIFTRDAKGLPRTVLTNDPLPWSTRERAPAGTYALAGWPLAEFHDSFAMYIVSRLRRTEPAVIAAERPIVAVSETRVEPRTAVRPEPRTATDPETRAGAAAGAEPAPSRGVLATAPILTASSVQYADFLSRPEARRSDDAYRRIVRAYAEARAAHLLGVPAREAYRTVAESGDASADDRAAEIAFNAKRFADRPSL